MVSEWVYVTRNQSMVKKWTSKRIMFVGSLCLEIAGQNDYISPLNRGTGQRLGSTPSRAGCQDCRTCFGSGNLYKSLFATGILGWRVDPSSTNLLVWNQITSNTVWITNSFSVKNPHKSVENRQFPTAFLDTNRPAGAHQQILFRTQKGVNSPRNRWNYFTLLLTACGSLPSVFNINGFFPHQFSNLPIPINVVQFVFFLARRDNPKGTSVGPCICFTLLSNSLVQPWQQKLSRR